MDTIKIANKYLKENLDETSPDDSAKQKKTYKEQNNLKCCYNCRYSEQDNHEPILYCKIAETEYGVEDVEPTGICALYKKG